LRWWEWFFSGAASGAGLFVILSAVVSWHVMHNPDKVVKYAMRQMKTNKKKGKGPALQDS
jgi:hypothetical protein